LEYLSPAEFDHAAYLYQLLPLAAVAGEADKMHWKRMRNRVRPESLSHCLGCVHARARKTLKVVFARRLALVGVDRMQRNFEPMRNQVEAWQRSELVDVTAKVVIYEAFAEGRLEAPKHLARKVHDLYFEPKYEAFRPRTIWSLSNAFTSAFKELDPIPQFKATVKLGEFLEARFSQSF